MADRPSSSLFHDWPTLRAVARHLLEQRERGLPVKVAKGQLAQADADMRLASARALVALWDAVADRRDIPAEDTLGTTWRAVAADLEHAAREAERRGLTQWGEDYPAAIAALAAQMRPIRPGGDPHIVFIHDINQRLRAQRRPDRRAA